MNISESAKAWGVSGKATQRSCISGQKRLLDLWQNKARASADVKRLALEHVREIEAKIEALITMRDAVEALAAACEGDHRPDCPILEDLERCGEPAC